jgi:anaerobic ribonucleoside-triphosphate reductase activating protein
MCIQIHADEHISEAEIKAILTEEEASYAKRGEDLAELSLTLDKNNDIIVKSYKRVPIKRIRRVTGYLSEEHNFNNAKFQELSDRTKHIELH